MKIDYKTMTREELIKKMLERAEWRKIERKEQEIVRAINGEGQHGKERGVHT